MMKDVYIETVQHYRSMRFVMLGMATLTLIQGGRAVLVQGGARSVCELFVQACGVFICVSVRARG